MKSLSTGRKQPLLCCLQRPWVCQPGTASSSETRASQSTNLGRPGFLGSLLITKHKAMREHKCNSNHSIKRNQGKANLESLVHKSIPKVNRGLLTQRCSQDHYQVHYQTGLHFPIVLIFLLEHGEHVTAIILLWISALGSIPSNSPTVHDVVRVHC